jgi:type I restriction enzyme S subunit
MAREYRDSGIEWIGQIPKEWEVCQIRRVMKNRSERNLPNAEVLSLYRDWGIVPKNSRDDNHNVTSEDTTNYKVVHKGDFVINKMKAWQGSMAVSDYDGIISPAYYVCEFVRASVYKRYIHHLLRNESYKTEYMRLSSGLRVGQWDLNIENFLRIPMILPSFSEQQKIADYLDKVCGEVDEMVALQETMIEELKAYKQSVITEAVTKGLNPNVPMRNSGIDWIGEIPKHWEVIKMRRCVDSIGDVDHYMPDSIETGIPYIMTRDLADRTSMINKNQCKQISYEDFANLSRKISIEKNDVIFARYASIGNVCFVDTDEEMIVSYSCVIIKPLPILSGLYLFYYLKSKTFEEEVLQFVNTNIQGNVGIDSLYKTKMMMPPLTEQQQIASYLDTKCSEIDSLITLKQTKIEELKEYKKSVIYEYVTGKKEVN